MQVQKCWVQEAIAEVYILTLEFLKKKVDKKYE